MYSADQAPTPGRESKIRRSSRGSGSPTSGKPPSAARAAIARIAVRLISEVRTPDKSAVRSAFGVGKRLYLLPRNRMLHSRPAALHQLPDQSTAKADRDQLAKNGCDEGLEAIPGARDPQARISPAIDRRDGAARPCVPRSRPDSHRGRTCAAPVARSLVWSSWAAPTTLA